MQGTFNREIAFDLDDDILIVPNFMTRKQNQLLVMPSATIVKICRQIWYAQKSKENPMLPHLNECATIVEDGPVPEECIVNGTEICPIGKKVNGKGRRFNSSFDKLILVHTLKSVSLWGLRLNS